MTISPFAREATRLGHEASLPADNWEQRRRDSIESHRANIEAVITTIYEMGHILLEDRISTDLRTYGKENTENYDPDKPLAAQHFAIVPAIYGSDRVVVDEHRSGWQPEAAMNVALLLEDTYDPIDSGTHERQPTGDVRLTVYIRTWGKLSEQEAETIAAVPDTETDYGDMGHHRKGTSVTIRRQPGEALTTDELEEVFGPLSQHVRDYYDIMRTAPEIREMERSGTFTTSKRAVERSTPGTHWERYRAHQPTDQTKALASNSLRLTELS